MSRIYGVLCDGCQKVDAVNAEETMYEDKVPRNNWASVTFWNSSSEKIYPVASADLHACSLDCLRKVIDLVEESNLKAP